MTASSRIIRIFISSTFRDMQAERDYLVKFIFPQLRKVCEERDVVWSEVDLRWGITAEQSAEGQVLPICLEEIRRCRPYFIGLLGERYGWIPDTIDPELINRECWLGKHLDQSVTELEILHGVLNNPEMSEHAHFYFRDPEYIQTLAQSQLSDFIEMPWREDIEKFGDQEAQKRVEKRKAKLADLKVRIRNSGFPLKENFRDPKQLGEWVLEDLITIIDRLYPEGSQPDMWSREKIGHKSFAVNQTKLFIGRKEYIKQLNEYAADGTQPLVILGKSGSGKSALLANWGLNYQANHPEELVLMHFIGATAISSNWAVMLLMIMGKLKEHFEIQEELPDKPDKIRSVFPKWLSAASAKGKVVLILDALNHLDDNEGAQELTWLPTQVPENIKIILSTLPGKVMGVVQERNWSTFTLQHLNQDEMEELVHDYLAQYSKQLSHAQVKRIVADPQSSNPLGLRIMLNELRQFGVHERLDEIIDLYLGADSIPEMYDLILKRCEADYEGDRPELVEEALSYIWSARHGLSEAELLDLLGSDGQPLPHRIWAPLYLALEQSLFDRGGLISFFHGYIRHSVENRYLSTQNAKTETHIKLADYFERLEGNPTRKVDELPWHLAQAKSWQKLYELLSELKFFQELWKHNQFDLLTYWATIETQTNLKRVDAYFQVVKNPAGFDLSIINDLSWLLHDSGNIQEAMTLNKEKERVCRKLGNMDGLHASLGDQANILYRWGKLKEAMSLYKEAERICRQLENLTGLQVSLGNQANILCDWGKLEEAMVLYKEEERIFRQLGILSGVESSLGSQALILKDWGLLNDAMVLFKEQERICLQLGNLNSLQKSLGNQSAILNGWGHKTEAMALIKEKERICRQLGNLDGLQSSLRRQANILSDWGQLKEAMLLHKEAEHICRELGNLDELHRSLGSQANILMLCNQLEEAMVLHREEENICRQLGNLAALASSLGNQALTVRMLGHLNEAMELNKEEERICRQLDNPHGLQRSLGNQAKILCSSGKFKEAVALLKEKESICRQLDNPFGLQSSLGNLAIVIKETGQLEEALELFKEQEQICHKINNPRDLAISLYYQAIISSKMGNLIKARQLIQTALDLGQKHGYQALVSRFETIKNRL